MGRFDTEHRRCEVVKIERIGLVRWKAIRKMNTYHLTHVSETVTLADEVLISDIPDAPYIMTVEGPTPESPVGGITIPTDKSGLIIPWLIAAALIAVASALLALWNRKRKSLLS